MASYPMSPDQAAAGPSNASQAFATRTAANVPGSRRFSLLGTRPNRQEPFAVPPAERMLEFRLSNIMGVGVYAKEDIPQGTRILVETALLAMPKNNFAGVGSPGVECPYLGYYDDPKYNRDVEYFCQKVIETGLHNELLKVMGTLSFAEDLALDQRTLDTFRFHLVGQCVTILDHDTLVRLWGDPNVGSLQPRASLTGNASVDYPIQSMDDLVMHYAKLYAIWNHNALTLTDDADAPKGVFRVASRINHACSPNVTRAWAKIGGFLPRGQESPDAYMAQTINTTRDIRRGEQILLAYQDYTLQHPQARDRALRARGIACCCCRLCTDPVVGALQRRASGLWHGASRWTMAFPRHEAVAAQWGLLFAQDGFEALQMAEELIDVLTHPSWDVREIALARAYKLASIICEGIASSSDQLGLPYQDAVAYWQKARVYSGKKVQVYILMQGTDGLAMRKADEQNKELGQRRMIWMAEQRHRAMVASGQMQ